MGDLGAAMASKAKKFPREKIVSTCTTASQFRRAKRYKGIAVIEVYSKTWGNCFCAFPGLQKLYMDAVDRIPIKLYEVECDDIAELTEYHGKANSQFLICKGGKEIETISGPNMPVLEHCVQENMPTADEFASAVQEPDSADEGSGGGTTAKTGGRSGRRNSLKGGLGRRRSLVGKN